MYYNKSLQKYLDDLAARKPAPGGGSSSALAAAMGASLVSMVVNFTLGKLKYDKYKKELRIILRKSEKLRKQFLKLVDLDVIAYQSRNIKKSLKVPLEVCVLSYEGIKLCPVLIKKGNLNLASDVAVAAVLLESAFMSAYFNVEVNLKYLNNDAVARNIRQELGRKAKRIKTIRQDTEVGVGKIIRG